MARIRKQEPLEFNMGDILDNLSSGLMRQADEPNMLGYRPHEKQLDFHKSEAYGRLLLGGNRAGKSVAGVVEDLWTVTKRHPYIKIPSHTQIRGRVVGSDFGTINTVLLPIFKRWVIPSDLINGSWEDSYDAYNKQLNFADGSLIDFRSNDQDLQKHAGTSRHFIHFDEEPPQAYFDENLQRLVDTDGRWWFTMTPDLTAMTWMTEILVEPETPHPPEMLHITRMAQSENIYLPKAGQSKASHFLSQDERDKRQGGRNVTRGGKVLAGYSEASHFKLPDGWRPPADWTVYTSQDHGYRTPAAVGWHAVHPSGRRIVTFHEIYGKQILAKDMAALMLKFEQENNITIFMRTGDPSMKQTSGITGTSLLYEYATHGVVIGVEGIPRDESIGIDRMNQYLGIDPETNQPYWELTRSCPKHNWEFKKLPWQTKYSHKLEGKVNPVEKVQDRDNHAFDEAKYFFTFMQDLGQGVSPAKTQFADNDDYVKSYHEAQVTPPDAHSPIKWEIQQSFPLDMNVVESNNGWNYGD